MNCTLFTQAPTPFKPTSATSPSFSHRGGFLPPPIPSGLVIGVSKNPLGIPMGENGTYVPVKIKSPGRSVVPRDRNEILLATPKTMSLVDESCTVSPLTLVCISSA